MNAAAYIRVSSANQARDDRSSLRNQLTECRRRARIDGFEIPKSLVFQDVMSGTRADRPAFVRLLEAAKQGEFSRIYVWSVDRFGRTMRHSVNAIQDLKDNGVGVISIKEGDMDNPLIFGVCTAWAEADHRRMQERMQPAKRAKQAAGHWVNGRPPFGYKMCKDKTLEVCPSEAEIVRQIFNDATHGLGRVAIARRLNVKKVPPPEIIVTANGGMRRRLRVRHLDTAEIDSLDIKNSGEWQSRTVAKVLSNTMAYGEKNGTRYKISPAPILSKQEFDVVHKAIMGRRQKGKSAADRWLLTGLLRCECGSRYHHHEGRGKNHRYKCSASRSGKTCANPSIPMDIADSWVLSRVSNFLFNLPSGYLQKILIDVTRAQTADLESELTELQSKTVELQSAHQEALEDFASARRAGVSDAYLQPLAIQIARKGEEYEKSQQRVARIIADIRHKESLYSLTAEEISAAEKALQHTFHLRGYHHDPDDVVGEMEELLDVYTVIRTIVEFAVVQRDGTISVSIRDFGKEPQLLQGLLIELAKKEAEFTRALKA